MLERTRTAYHELDEAEATARKEMMESASHRNPMGTSIANTVAAAAAEKNAKKAAAAPKPAATASAPKPAATASAAPAKTTTTASPVKATTTPASTTTTGASKKPSVGALTKNFENQNNTHLTGVAREGQTGGVSHASYTSTQMKPKASQSTVNAPHPVYSKMQTSNGPMKKVVLPPNGAYC